MSQEFKSTFPNLQIIVGFFFCFTVKKTERKANQEKNTRKVIQEEQSHLHCHYNLSGSLTCGCFGSNFCRWTFPTSWSRGNNWPNWCWTMILPEQGLSVYSSLSFIRFYVWSFNAVSGHASRQSNSFVSRLKTTPGTSLIPFSNVPLYFSTQDGCRQPSQ